MKMDKLTEAKTCLEDTLMIEQQISNDVDTDINVARTLHTLGECLIEMNDFNEAKTCLEQAMQIKQISSNDTSSQRSLAVTLYTLGQCLMKRRSTD